MMEDPLAKMFPEKFKDEDENMNNPEHTDHVCYSVYNKLRTLPNNYYVFHIENKEYDFDFIVFNGKDVLICIYLKTGMINYSAEERKWYLDKEPSNNDFIEKAIKASHKLKGEPDYARFNLKDNLYIHWAFCFPNCYLKPDNKPILELRVEQILDQKKLLEIKDAIRDLEAHIKQIFHKKNCLHKEQITDFAKAIIQKYKISNKLNEQEYRIEQATKEQCEIETDLLQNSKMIINGAAGTGKSTIAINFANKLGVKTKKILFLVSNETIAFAIKPRIENPNVIIMTYSQLLQAKFNNNEFDAIIVEDGHEYSLEDFKLIEILLSTAEDAHYAIFLDNNRDKNIIKHWENKNIKKDFVRITLTKNCRNTKYIIEYLNSKLNIKMACSEHVPVGDKVEEIPVQSLADESNKVRAVINKLLKQKVSSGKIVILLNSPKEESFLGKDDEICGKELVSVKTGYNEDTKDKYIYYAISDEFNGLDSDVIILSLGSKLTDSESILNAIYTQGSRARLKLYIFTYTKI
jgi:adenylate kinase family enzyme